MVIFEGGQIMIPENVHGLCNDGLQVLPCPICDTQEELCFQCATGDVLPETKRHASDKKLGGRYALPFSLRERARLQIERVGQSAELRRQGRLAVDINGFPHTVEPGDPPPQPRPSVFSRTVCEYCGGEGRVGWGIGDLVPAAIRGEEFVVHSKCWKGLQERVRGGQSGTNGG